MLAVLLKAGSFLFIIALGYLLKRAGFFAPHDYRLITKIVLNITLPAAIVTSFADFEMRPALLFVVLIGFCCNAVLLFLGVLLSRGRDDRAKVFYLVNSNGYNIGAFTLPYVQSFLGSFGVVVTCLFDAGNAVIATGGSYALMPLLLGKGKGSVGVALKKLVSSVPFDFYMGMLALALLDIHPPAALVRFIAPVGAANSFLAMLMIGMMFDLRLAPGAMRDVVKLLALRLGAAAAFSLLFYYCLPLALEIRQALAIVVFAPIAALAPVFTDKCGGDVALAGLTNSLCIVCSVVIITSLMMGMNLG